jgi:hypothetical protein
MGGRPQSVHQGEQARERSPDTARAVLAPFDATRTLAPLAHNPHPEHADTARRQLRQVEARLAAAQEPAKDAPMTSDCVAFQGLISLKT